MTLPVQRNDKRGRPTIFTPTLAERFVNLIAQGNTWRKACRKPGMPGTTTIAVWLATYPAVVEGDEASAERARAYDAFREQLARAYEARAELRGERIEGYIRRTETEDMEPNTLRALVEAQRVLMEIESPKKYGKAITLKGSKSDPLQNVTRHDLSDEALAAIAAGGLKNAT